MEDNKIPGSVRRFMKKRKADYIFKTLTSSTVSFAVTILFTLLNGYLGIRLKSVWHGSICVFYLLLAIIRGAILLTEKNNRIRDEALKAQHRRKTFVISAGMLLLLDMALALPISLMVIMEKLVNMTLVPAIAMATYTTYKITTASVHLRRQKKNEHNNILVSELRIINFIDALVSILTLQNTLIMVNQKGSSGNNMLILSAVSSAAVLV